MKEMKRKCNETGEEVWELQRSKEIGRVRRLDFRRSFRIKCHLPRSLLAGPYEAENSSIVREVLTVPIMWALRSSAGDLGGIY